MNTTTQIQVAYLGEYVPRSIILEPVVPNKREGEGGESLTVERGDTLGFEQVGGKVPCPHALGHLYSNGYYKWPLGGVGFYMKLL
jgi:nitrogen fixation protein